MRAKQIAVRAALVGAAATAGLALWSATEDTAAHAADHRPAVEQPGGPLDQTVRLPEQAAARAMSIVEQATEATPEPAPVEPETSDGPAPDGEDQGDEPSPDTSDRSSEPAPADPVVDVPPVVGETPPVVDTPPVEAPPAEVPPADLPLPAPTPNTEDAAPVVTLPSTDPTPRPDVEPRPVPTPSTVIVLPVPLILIGPVPAAAPLAAVDPPAAPAEPATLEVPPCADEHVPAAPPVDQADTSSSDSGRQLAVRRSQPGKPCPGTPGNPIGYDAGACPAPASAQAIGPQCLADVTAGIVAPTLARLKHARARSAIPTGRATHLDPRPA